MEFQCPRCQTPYKISDHHVRGGSGTVPCRKCGATIELRWPKGANAPLPPRILEPKAPAAAPAAESNDDRARARFAAWIGNIVCADLDGVIFDDEPNTFQFRFADPSALREEVRERFTDEMDMEPWSGAAIIAAVSAPARGTDEFAWLFLAWDDDGSDPRVLIATHDNWGGALAAGMRFGDLGLT